VLQGGDEPELARPVGPQARARGATNGHSIAPTEFPKKRSAAVGNRVARPPYAAACALQVEGVRPQSRPKAATGWDLPPEILQNGSHRPAIHRPEITRPPAEASRTSVPPSKPDSGAKVALDSPAASKEKGITPPPIDALTRVDVACRYVGNEVGW
jgi:hypothetical protein